VDASGEARELKRDRLAPETTTLRLNVGVPFGTERVVVEIHHPGLGQAAVLSTPAFRGEEEDGRISDLLLVSPVTPERRTLSRATLDADPQTGLETPASVGIFFEVYDLAGENDRYRVRVELQPEGSQTRLPVRFRPAGQRAFQPEWSLRTATRQAPFPEYLTVALPGVGPGLHTLHLLLETEGGESLHKTLDLRVIGASAADPEEGLEAAPSLER